MHIINARYESLDVLPVSALFGAVGIYTLWSSHAQARPSYLGEGILLERLVEHVRTYGSTLKGYAAVMTEGTDRERKADAQIVETALLEVADRIDQTPVHNGAGGVRHGLAEHFQAGHNVVRINVTGFHPLRWGSKLVHRAEIAVRLFRGENSIECDIDDPWRRIG